MNSIFAACHKVARLCIGGVWYGKLQVHSNPVEYGLGITSQEREVDRKKDQALQELKHRQTKKKHLDVLRA